MNLFTGDAQIYQLYPARLIHSNNARCQAKLLPVPLLPAPFSQPPRDIISMGVSVKWNA